MVMLGGAAGSLTRYLVGIAIINRLGSRFPLGTFLINVSGSFLVGLLITLLTERLQPHPNWHLLLVVGYLGGYTTFSSFEWETLSLVKHGGLWLGVFNAAGSVLLGYAAVWLGWLIGAKR
ncbi:MAG: fluoride efflux transporter CrcB [Acidobacteriia bacterium]|nr:fluoride efflux transporter CrcB [Terriglobia bacterium]